MKHIPVGEEEKAEEHRAGNEIAIETAIDRQRKREILGKSLGEVQWRKKKKWDI